jgi:hypothetical protein
MSNYISKIKLSGPKIWKNQRSLLGHLDIELTEPCNNNCIHCCISLPDDDFRAKSRKIITGDIKKDISKGGISRCFDCTFYRRRAFAPR